MDKISLIKRLTRAKTDEVLHTSGYAQAQNGDGATSTQSFSERQEINDNRQYVRGYNESALGTNTFNHRITKDNSPLVKYNNIKSNNVNSRNTDLTPRNSSALSGTSNYGMRLGLSSAKNTRTLTGRGNTATGSAGVKNSMAARGGNAPPRASGMKLG